MGGQVDLEFAVDGLRCSIRAPVDARGPQP